MRRAPLFPELLSILLVALLGVATNYATDDNGRVPRAVQLIRAWSGPLLLATILALVIMRIWQHRLNRPIAPGLQWKEDRSPYPGLDAFTEDEAAVFRGRKAEVQLLLDRTQFGSDSPASRFIAVVGPSGSGKSSLLQAGLVPNLTQRRGKWAVVPPFVPEHSPIRSLAVALASAEPRVEVASVDATDPRALDDRLRQIRTHQGARAHVLLVIDQGEELFTLSGTEQRNEFMTLIERALTDHRWLWVVTSLRSEFLTSFLNSPHAALFQQPVAVGFLDRTALFEVVNEPAKQAGITFDPPSLINRIVDDARSGEALPLLAYTLYELWQRAHRGKVITDTDYEEIGKVDGALTKQANRVVADLGAHGLTEREVLQCLLKLVRVEGGTATRQRLRRSGLSESEERIVDAFVDARLLTSDKDAEGQRTVHVAHESLIETWPPLKDEVAVRNADLQLRGKIEDWAKEWHESGRLADYLLTGERLRMARNWAKSGDGGSPLTRDLIEASSMTDRAIVHRTADVVADRILEHVGREPELAIMAALAAIREYTLTPLCRQVLTSALAVSRLRAVLHGGGPLQAVAWSPDGLRIAAGADHLVHLWNAAGGDEIAALAGHSGPVTAVAWDHDGVRLASGSQDGTVRLWTVAASTAPVVLRISADAVTSVAWSPDGHALVAGHADGTVHVWDVRKPMSPSRVLAGGGRVTAVAWSADGTAIASGSADRTVRVWRAPFDGPPRELTGHQRPVTSVDWEPAGTRLASGSEDWSLRIWDPETGEELDQLQGHDVALKAVAWAPDGGRIVTSTTDRMTMIWDPARRTPLSVLRGHDGSVTDVSWSPDGTQVATCSVDGTVRIWSAALTVLRHGWLTRAVTWAPDDRFLASSSGDRDIRLWDTAVGRPIGDITGHDAEVYHSAWSPDGTMIASCGRDADVKIWDARTHDLLHNLTGQEGSKAWVAWSTDSKTLASASQGGSVYLWDSSNGRVRRELSFPGGTTWAGWSPDGTRLAVVLWDGGVHIEDQDGQDAVVMTGHTDDVWSASWSPDGRRIATGSFDRTIRIWDTTTGEELHRVEAHDEPVYAVAWSPGDGTWLASVARDRTVRLWDVQDLHEVAVLRGHDEPIWGLNWSHDGSRLATSSDDGVIRIWDMTLAAETALSQAEGLGLRRLTVEERVRFALPPEPVGGAGGNAEEAA
ncbi:hypothetical protein AB0F81_24810 [Actinoplanes sp. NPDC024001]|uniref:nSTAND1 domain-containing NTPase n=1 Tax=Actinoplanes sp. NPDC024001 TaxID=3154598 RepID=UPI0033EA27A6